MVARYLMPPPPPPTRLELADVIYLVQVILSNISKSYAKVDVLLQIPVGSIPLNNGFFTQGKFVELSPNSTQVLQYYFYFPQASDVPLAHFPAQVLP